jgi:hypothetical protein
LHFAEVCHRNSPARVSLTTRSPPRFASSINTSLLYICFLWHLCTSPFTTALRDHQCDILSSGQGRFQRQGPQRVLNMDLQAMSRHEANSP